MFAIVQVPEEDLRTALFMTLLAWGRHMEVDQKLWRQEHERTNKAEAMLKSNFPDN